MIAVCRIRDQPHYRRQAFVGGLQAAGFSVAQKGDPKGQRDVLVIWNRYGWFEQDADRWERDGGTVIVCENGYLGKDDQGRQFYAISVSQHHHGLPLGNDDRLAALNVDLKPWRQGEHILICGQRGIGSRKMRSPANWHIQAAAKLSKITKRPIRIRHHPGNQPPKTPLEEDLRDAHACVIWSSGSGVKSLVLGVPVFYDAPRWICEGAALKSWDVENPLRDDDRRLEAFHRMAQCQFTVDEIASGLPFRRILESLPG